MSDAVEEFLTLCTHKEKQAKYDYAKSVLLRGTLPGAITGTATGALAASPEDRLKSALIGGATGAALGSAGVAAHERGLYQARKNFAGFARQARKDNNPVLAARFDSILAGEKFKNVFEKVPKRYNPEHQLLRHGETKRLGLTSADIGAIAGGAGATLATLPFALRRRAAKENEMDKESMDKAAFIRKLLAGGKAVGSRLSGAFGKRMEKGVTDISAAGALTLGTYGATKAIEAATRAVGMSRGYKKMMEINPDLAERDEEQVKGMYNLMYKASPTFAANPYVAGGFVRRTEHASQYVDPKMVADLAGAEQSVRRNAMSDIAGPMNIATTMMSLK